MTQANSLQVAETVVTNTDVFHEVAPSATLSAGYHLMPPIAGFI